MPFPRLLILTHCFAIQVLLYLENRGGKWGEVLLLRLEPGRGSGRLDPADTERCLKTPQGLNICDEAAPRLGSQDVRVGRPAEGHGGSDRHKLHAQVRPALSRHMSTIIARAHFKVASTARCADSSIVAAPLSVLQVQINPEPGDILLHMLDLRSPELKEERCASLLCRVEHRERVLGPGRVLQPALSGRAHLQHVRELVQDVLARRLEYLRLHRRRLLRDLHDLRRHP
eukprot:2145061-Rhodomonas_salina.1